MTESIAESLSFEEREHLDKLVVRTDFSSEEAWQSALSAMNQPWDAGEAESTTYRVNDPVWGQTSVERIRDAALRDDCLSIVFLADEQTMTSPDHMLLAINLNPDPNYLDEGYDVEHGTSFGRQFRILPNEASGVHINLALGNMDYEHWAGPASEAADGVFRGF